ncbi:MAG TPA: MFS transporter [Gaiellaceae bacterium]|nr:MFS transporter [Gaiellaceae bacterium]
MAAVTPPPAAFPIRRNSVLLAACLAASGGMMQVAVAVGTTTLVLVTGIESIVGLGPAIFLSTAALAALPAGRAMDRYGRMPVVAGGFVAGILATTLVALGCLWESTPLVVLGLGLVGASSGTVILSRAAAADMYPAERRARGISLVLFGAVFGAALGPLVFKPLFAGDTVDTDSLVLPWLVAGAIMVVGLLLALAVRPDPKRIGESLGYGVDENWTGNEEAAPLSTILRRPGVLAALVAAVASFAVMVSVMTLSGYIVVGHGHNQGDTFWVISVHIVGMYGLVLVVGDVIDRVGRRPALVGGLAVMGVSTAFMAWIESVLAMSLSLFGLGLGWSLSYVAATSELVDRAALSERGRLVGFSDLLAGFTGASLAILGGVAYDGLGVEAVAAGATLAVALPALLITVAGRRPQEVAEATS